MPRRSKYLEKLENPERKIQLYTPHVHQREIVEDKHRFKVVVCGRRFGKTTFAINELFLAAASHTGSAPGIYWYVGPTYRQAKMIAWRMLEQICYNLPPEVIRRSNEAELMKELYNGSVIEIKGADNEDSLRGTYIDGVIMDEYAFMKARVFEKIIAPSLADHQGWAIFIGTPYGYNHFHDYFIRGQGTHKDWKSWKFKSVDNPFLKPEEIELARATSDPAVFAQEWEADFRMFKGLIYKDFDPNVHVKAFEINPGWTFYRGMDFGGSNPTVCLWLGVDYDDNLFMFDEYYEPGRSADYHAGIILARYPNLEFRATFGDPSALQEHIDYARWKLYVTPATRFFTTEKGTSESWVKAGINQVATKLRQDAATKAPKLFIHPRCKHTIKEIQSYEWEELRTGIPTDKPKKVNDHCMDALRYIVCSYGGVHKKVQNRNYTPNNSITGY